MRRRRQRSYSIPVAVGKEETLALPNQHIETQITLKCSIWEAQSARLPMPDRRTLKLVQPVEIIRYDLAVAWSKALIFCRVLHLVDHVVQQVVVIPAVVHVVLEPGKPLFGLLDSVVFVATGKLGAIDMVQVAPDLRKQLRPPVIAREGSLTLLIPILRKGTPHHENSHQQGRWDDAILHRTSNVHKVWRCHTQRPQFGCRPGGQRHLAANRIISLIRQAAGADQLAERQVQAQRATQVRQRRRDDSPPCHLACRACSTVS